MTEALYSLDSYLRSFSATVVAVDDQQRAVELDRSAFYPGGGGQPYDLGALSWDGGRGDVTRMQRQDGRVLHLLDDALPEPGMTVRGELDWPRRYALMRTHTAMHLLCGVVWRDYCAQVTGGNMDVLQGRMDFEFEHMQKELVAEIEAAVNAEIAAQREVRVAVLPRAVAFEIPDLIRTKISLLPAGIEQVRTVELVGLDLQADGGTHVANTGEVGRVLVTGYKSKGRINKRIEIQVLDPA